MVTGFKCNSYKVTRVVCVTFRSERMPANIFFIGVSSLSGFRRSGDGVAVALHVITKRCERCALHEIRRLCCDGGTNGGTKARSAGHERDIMNMAASLVMFTWSA